MNTDLINFLSTLTADEIVQSLSKVALPWECDPTRTGYFVRRDVTGRNICSGQQTYRQKQEADASLTEQGYQLLHQTYICADCLSGQDSMDTPCTECKSIRVVLRSLVEDFLPEAQPRFLD